MRIEDYAMIGDLNTAALVGRDGSIDWLCWPNFASAACFAALLGTEDNGFWRIGPTDRVQTTLRQYQPHTLILETTYQAQNGSVQVIDFMPPRNSHSHVVRLVKGIKGLVAMRSTLALRFGYGQAIPWVTRTDRGIRAVAGPDAVELHTEAPLQGEQFTTVSDFTIEEGQTISFVLTYGHYGNYQEHSIGHPLDVINAYEQTRAYWT